MLLYYGLVFILPVNILFIIYLIYSKFKKKKSILYILSLIIFSIYIQIMISLTLFPIHIGIDFGTINIWKYINLIPLYKNLSALTDKQIWANIILTVPLGFALSWIFDLKRKYILLLCFLLSSSIEILQLLIILTFKDITFIVDINDLIFNIFGSYLGYFVFYIFCFVINKKNKNNCSNNIFVNYLNKVALNVIQGNSSLHDII